MMSRLSSRTVWQQPKTTLLLAPVLRAQQVRNGASQALVARIKVVKNIEKITKAMKMVATARLRRSQERMKTGREFAKVIADAWPAPTVVPNPPFNNILYVGLAADRGLCGAANSSIVRAIRDKVKESKDRQDKSIAVVSFGDRARAGIEALFKQHFAFAISESGKNNPLSFDQVLELVDMVTKQKHDRMDVVWNKFKNMMTYETTTTSFYPLNVAYDAKMFAVYEEEGDNEIFQNFYEYRMGCMYWHYFRELETVELSARMNAMTNSNKSAGELGGTLTRIYNKKRQEGVTTELVEIVSGAIALETKD